ncbi:MAG: Type 1 glutamine amidotransferase-like domain-containing protein [Candidatus Daviesbacteria bacterium]|nr:Type 1 glutamine amidotransferase-like domain-containing protein [Candidatus Daviesbacteria bacterium]
MKKLFLTSSVNFVAADIAKKLDLSQNNKLVFINTAGEYKEKDLSWQDEDRNSLVRAGFDVFDYTITEKKPDQLMENLKEVDYIYVSGGNTFYLLEKAQESGFIKVVKDLILKMGKIYISTSAGSIIAGPDIYPSFRLDDASKAPKIKGYKGFDLVDFTVLPHWGSDKFRDLYLNKRLEHAYTANNQLILLTDNQYIEIVDDWYRICEVK